MKNQFHYCKSCGTVEKAVPGSLKSFLHDHSGHQVITNKMNPVRAKGQVIRYQIVGRI